MSQKGLIRSRLGLSKAESERGRMIEMHSCGGCSILGVYSNPGTSIDLIRICAFFYGVLRWKPTTFFLKDKRKNIMAMKPQLKPRDPLGQESNCYC